MSEFILPKAPNYEGALLLAKDVTMRFGGVTAVSDLSIALPKGAIAGIIGPNGAGKTTAFNVLSGFYTPQEGDVIFGGKSVKGLGPAEICNLGMARTFQNIRLFPAMTVLENVMIGRHCRTSTSILDAILGSRKAAREEKESVDKSYQLLKKVGLADVADEFSRNLSYGAQRRLEIARAMATDPFLLLLDEPAAGMNPQETRELDELIVRIRNEDKLAVLLIEHDMKLVMNISDRIYVMEYGKEIAQGTPQQIKENPKVIEAYLGEEAHA